MLPSRTSLRRLPITIIGALTLALALPAPAVAQGDLLIAPTRLVLDGRRGGEVILSNIGDEEATYRIEIELRRMTPEGELVPVDLAEASATEKAALEMIRYAPRRVVLPPREPQAIRITARPGAELPDGEYRVHLSFAAIPKVQALTPQAADAPEEGFSINLVPIYGITMPVIIRKGQLEVTAGLANPRIEQGPEGPAFLVDITRAGTESIYGDLLVYRQGSDEPALVVRGIGVYPEIDNRHSAFPLTPEQAEALRGPARVELRESILSGGALITAVDAVLR
jgi:hypothetical protein